jgi:hypothetical protein
MDDLFLVVYDAQMFEVMKTWFGIYRGKDEDEIREKIAKTWDRSVEHETIQAARIAKIDTMIDINHYQL